MSRARPRRERVLPKGNFYGPAAQRENSRVTDRSLSAVPRATRMSHEISLLLVRLNRLAAHCDERDARIATDPAEQDTAFHVYVRSHVLLARIPNRAREQTRRVRADTISETSFS